MGWIAPSGVPAVTGARWSAGAYWAEAADPQATDSEWEDEADWPRTHPGTAERIALGVFVAGVDLAYWAQALSWLTGTEEAFPTTIPMGSANLTFRDDAPAAAVGDRVVLVTEYETLWAGRIESADVESAPNLPDAVTYSAVDDLERAAQVQLSIRLGGLVLYYAYDGTPYTDGLVLQKILDASGLSGGTIIPMHTRHVSMGYLTAVHEGSALELLGQALYQCGYMGSYSPAGLRIRTRGLWVENDYQAVTLEDCQDVAASWATRQEISDVVTVLEGYGQPISELEALNDGAWSVTLRPAARAYGKRSIQVNDEEWGPSSSGSQVSVPIISEILEDFVAPFERVQASYRVLDTDSAAHKLQPFDWMQQDSDNWYAKRVSHSLTVDEWRVDVAAFPADSITHHSAKYPYLTTEMNARLGAL